LPCKLSIDLEIISSDGLAKLFVPIGTNIVLPGTNTSLYLEVKSPGQASETYAVGPNGTTFDKDITLGIKKYDCETKFLEYSVFNKQAGRCEDGFVIASFNTI
jgi:hypothetical protein